MFCIPLESDDPFFNLALEEVLLKNSQDEFLILGINNPSVIIGKHQSAHREVNTKFVIENNIPVIRRISGGGTVFHDKGNLNFTFIRQSESGKQVDFRKYTLPVIEFLSSIGVEAKFEGKNDLKVGGFKISGNAEHIYRNRVLHHGTILFSTSLDMLRNSIRKDKSCYTTRAVESNPSSVMNLNVKLTGYRDIYEFKTEMMRYLQDILPDALNYQLSDKEINEAQLLSETKYKTWEWNWAYGPEYTFNNTFQLNGEDHSCMLFVKEGIINECSINGSDKMVLFADNLIGCKHMVSEMTRVFKDKYISISEVDIFSFF
jgi:lipoate---protein ligase